MEDESDQQACFSENELQGMIWPISMSKQQSLLFGYNEEDELAQLENDQQIFKDQFHNYLISQNVDDKENGKKFLNVFANDSNSFQIINSAASSVYDFEPLINQIPKLESIDLKKPKFQNKSYCRYILLYVFRTIENELYQEVVMDICSKYRINVKQFKDYYRKQRILIMGYQQLKKELVMDNDTIEVQKRKCAFKEFLIWYMDKLGSKHILNSKKKDLKEYLKFKNEVMSYYIHVPKNWLGNRPEWLKQQ